MQRGIWERLAAGLFLLLLINTAYLAAFASPTIFYMANVLLHVYGGVAAAAVFGWLLIRRPELRRGAAVAAVTFGVCLAFGLWLAQHGNLRADRWALWVHIAAGLAGVAALFPYLDRKVASLGGGWPRFRRVFQATVAGGFVFAFAGIVLDPFHGRYATIRNPQVTPASMEEEGGGPDSPFWPSSAKTNVGGLIPSDFFLESEKCGECHKDIYEQWRASAHHFSSFNNQYYRRSIEHMQELSGTKGSRWCASCHDHAMFFNGRFDQPAIEQIDTPQAHAGLGCVSCHSIVHVEGSMGNGGFTIEYPAIHDLASSDNPFIRRLDRFLTFAAPEPHRRTFLKPFMKNSSEFCSACHKVHLDVPVNNYRWIRGFNDYDNWQASGVSGQGARSFYYPEQSMTCGDCHMPLVPSKDPGNRNGMVHSHRFPAANTALAHVNRDAEQMRITEEFLKSGFITVDIFAATPAEEAGLPMMRRSGEGPQIASTFAVGEEAEQARHVVIREVGAVSAPIDQAGAVFRPGSKVKLDVVVRTRRIGHFFPGGTVDSFDVWLEVQARDAAGRIIFWSGQVEDDGRGPVEPGAHFYRSFLLDGEGNPIDKRNAWQARSVLYVRLIPPGAADVAHYRLALPPDVKGPVTVTAKLQHRKFSHFYNQYSYAGQPKPGQPEDRANREHDSREYSFDKANIPKNVSGRIKGEIPTLPIVTMAEARTTLQVGDPRTETVWQPAVRKQDRERWNDWGIGLLLQGDLKGAEFAFKKVTEAEPEYADGWLNVARAMIQEGETEAAKPYIEKALSINPTLGRIYYFKALVEKADGDYEAALKSLETVASKYPRDRVVQNEIGRILFLQRNYAGAVEALERVIDVDPEDLQAHYTLMLVYRGLGDKEKAARSQKLFLRFKADEASQTITARRRMISPEDNNERQMIHDHVSVPLGSGAAPPQVSRQRGSSVADIGVD
ncbi:MAG: tetratricopeptide repeat protein [Bryobacteraceae bacterium]|nr:tetratricopeptide repeat protein [Bryobacteraceae bacterium]